MSTDLQAKPGLDADPAFLETLLQETTKTSNLETSKADASPWVVHSERHIPLLAWSDFSGCQKLIQWSQQLTEARTKDPEQVDWGLLGQAAMIQAAREDAAVFLARLIAHEAGLAFVFVGADEFSKNCLSILDKASSLDGALLYISQGHWQSDRNDSRLFAKEISAHLARSNSLFLVSWVEDFNAVHPSLRTAGVFDRNFRVFDPPDEERAKSFFSWVGESLCSDELLNAANKVGKLLLGQSIDDLKRIALHLRREVSAGKHKVTIADLIHVHLRDTIELEHRTEDSLSARELVAYHEAGHAAIGIIDSGGKFIPEYASIIGADDFKGVVMPSLDSITPFLGGVVSFSDYRHRVRISLAGRAAEELMYGPTNVCIGARQDLINATRLALDMFVGYGFAPDMDQPGQSASNLAILPDELPADETVRSYALVRNFLAAEYAEVLRQLTENRPLVEAIKKRLMVDPVVDQDELKDLCRLVGYEI